MEVQRMPDTCTGLHFYSFIHDVNWTDHYKPYIEAQKKAIKTQLDSAKLGRYVNVFAFLIGTQQKSKAQLEEFGFVCAADHHNYKYPDTSKRLYMMVKDMNDWEVKVEKKEAVNTFAAPITAPTRVDRNQQIINRRPVVSTHHGLTFAAERNGIRHQSLGMYNATQNDVGSYVTPAGAIIDHPFPLNEWVDIPNEIVECPPALVGQNCEVRLYRGRQEFYPARREWSWHAVGESNQIVSVRRVP